MISAWTFTLKILEVTSSRDDLHWAEPMLWSYYVDDAVDSATVRRWVEKGRFQWVIFLVGVSALSSLQCFDTVGRATGRHWSAKTSVTYHQSFFSRTKGGRKPRWNRLFKVHLQANGRETGGAWCRECLKNGQIMSRGRNRATRCWTECWQNGLSEWVWCPCRQVIGQRSFQSSDSRYPNQSISLFVN